MDSLPKYKICLQVSVHTYNVDNYYVNSCSHHMADSHQLHDPGESEQYSAFHLDLLCRVVLLSPVE